MRSRRWSPLVLLLVLLAAAILFFLLRRRLQAGFGPPVALCPGPDEYGYTCESGTGFSYIDASNDTLLYADDGVVTLDLPFPFVFYGTTYTEVQASSNGNVQFGNANPWFSNDCMSSGPVPLMGDMIAPYWDDLDLRAFGFLEYETVGTAPERIFVIEWDEVPRFGDDSDDPVTFELQLFEKNNDILFLYQRVSTSSGYNGSSATIGLQSEAQRLALQYGCQQPVVADASGVFFPSPIRPNAAIGLASSFSTHQADASSLAVKGRVDELLTTLEQRGKTALTQLRAQWRNQRPPLVSEWAWLDLNGDRREDLVFLWTGDRRHPEMDQLVVLMAGASGEFALTLDTLLSVRQPERLPLTIVEVADLTHDGVQDLLLAERGGARLEMLSSGRDAQVARHPIPEACLGSLALRDMNGDGQLDIVRDGCHSHGRVSYTWESDRFVKLAGGEAPGATDSR